MPEFKSKSRKIPSPTYVGRLHLNHKLSSRSYADMGMVIPQHSGSKLSCQAVLEREYKEAATLICPDCRIDLHKS